MSTPEPQAATQPGPPALGSVAVVVVTFNRSELLGTMLDGLAAMQRGADRVFVVDNASTDNTADVLAGRTEVNLTVISSEVNDGGAGGFRRGARTAFEAGYDWIWLMDDDVVPAADCLSQLLTHAQAHNRTVMMAVREDRAGNLCEKAATRFDLATPWAIRPKREMVEDLFASRADMPTEVELHNVAFEGFMMHRSLIEAIGLPDERFFIFYDDVDFALRARAAGFTIVAVRDAVLVRQLDFDQQHDMKSWKGYYMYRNLFVVHLRYGENALVRLKPYLIAVIVVLLAPLRGGRAEAQNVVRAIRDAPSLSDTRR